MSRSNFVPAERGRTEAQIGLVFEDQRTGDLRRVIYVDSRIVLVRDETGHTTLTPRGSFEADLETRYQPRMDADPDVDGGQYDSLRDRLAEYESEEGRKASHKAEALREALDLVAGRPRDPTDDVASTETPDRERSGETAQFEGVPGIGSDTAGKLRTQGFVTEADVRSASDEEILAVSGVGPANLERLREFVD